MSSLWAKSIVPTRGDASYKCPICSDFCRTGWEYYGSRDRALIFLQSHLNHHVQNDMGRSSRSRDTDATERMEGDLVWEKAKEIVPIKDRTPYKCPLCKDYHISGWAESPSRKHAIANLFHHLQSHSNSENMTRSHIPPKSSKKNQRSCSQQQTHSKATRTQMEDDSDSSSDYEEDITRNSKDQADKKFTPSVPPLALQGGEEGAPLSSPLLGNICDANSTPRAPRDSQLDERQLSTPGTRQSIEIVPIGGNEPYACPLCTRYSRPGWSAYYVSRRSAINSLNQHMNSHAHQRRCHPNAENTLSDKVAMLRVVLTSPASAVGDVNTQEKQLDVEPIACAPLTSSPHLDTELPTDELNDTTLKQPTDQHDGAARCALSSSRKTDTKQMEGNPRLPQTDRENSAYESASESGSHLASEYSDSDSESASVKPAITTGRKCNRNIVLGMPVPEPLNSAQLDETKSGVSCDSESICESETEDGGNTHGTPTEKIWRRAKSIVPTEKDAPYSCPQCSNFYRAGWNHYKSRDSAITGLHKHLQCHINHPKTKTLPLSYTHSHTPSQKKLKRNRCHQQENRQTRKSLNSTAVDESSSSSGSDSDSEATPLSKSKEKAIECRTRIPEPEAEDSTHSCSESKDKEKLATNTPTSSQKLREPQPADSDSESESESECESEDGGATNPNRTLAGTRPDRAIGITTTIPISECTNDSSQMKTVNVAFTDGAYSSKNGNVGAVGTELPSNTAVNNTTCREVVEATMLWLLQTDDDDDANAAGLEPHNDDDDCVTNPTHVEPPPPPPPPPCHRIEPPQHRQSETNTVLAHRPLNSELPRPQHARQD
ncbi:hypothetical protein Pelo_17672 [Pelomyxa schiedti]|nr:hypothetical protein Pelo_17672 [Pelomyxa schiedti]